MKSNNLQCIHENEQLSSLWTVPSFPPSPTFPNAHVATSQLKRKRLDLYPATNTQRPANSLFERSTIVVQLFACPRRERFLVKLYHENRKTDKNIAKMESSREQVPSNRFRFVSTMPSVRCDRSVTRSFAQHTPDNSQGGAVSLHTFTSVTEAPIILCQRSF